MSDSLTWSLSDFIDKTLLYVGPISYAFHLKHLLLIQKRHFKANNWGVFEQYHLNNIVY